MTLSYKDLRTLTMIQIENMICLLFCGLFGGISMTAIELIKKLLLELDGLANLFKINSKEVLKEV